MCFSPLFLFSFLFLILSRLFLFLSFAFSLFLSLSLFYFLSLALYLSPSFPLSPPLPLSLSVCVSSLTRFVSGSSRATYPLSPGFQLCPPPGISRLAATRRGSLSSLEPGETPAFPPPPRPGLSGSPACAWWAAGQLRARFPEPSTPAGSTAAPGAHPRTPRFSPARRCVYRRGGESGPGGVAEASVCRSPLPPGSDGARRPCGTSSRLIILLIRCNLALQARGSNR